MTVDLMAQLEAALANPELAEAWKSAPAESGSIYDAPPDGTYDALVHEFEFIAWEAKSADKPAGIGLKVRYQVTNHATYAGRVVDDLFGLRPDRIGWLKGWLEKFGVNTAEMELSDLRPGDGGILDGILDTPLTIKIVRKGGYVNAYVQDVFEKGAVRTSDVTPPQAGFDFAPTPRNARAADDDIPF